jgi:hypothetical protein
MTVMVMIAAIIGTSRTITIVVPLMLLLGTSVEIITPSGSVAPIAYRCGSASSALRSALRWPDTPSGPLPHSSNRQVRSRPW